LVNQKIQEKWMPIGGIAIDKPMTNKECMLENLELIREELKWLHDYNSFDYDTMLEKDRKLFHDTTLKELDRIIGLVQNLVDEEQ